MAKKLKANWGSSDSRCVTIGFFSPDSRENQQNSCISWMVKSWTNGTRNPALCFTHVELRFSDRMVISITNEGIHYEQRVLSSNGYSTFFKIDVSVKQEIEMKNLAQDIFNQKPTFNWVGLVWNFAPLTNHCAVTRQNAYFCTELIVMILQKADIFIGAIPHKTSPNQLFDMCMNEPMCVLTYNKLKMEN